MKKATAWLLTLAMLMSLVVTSFASDSGLAVTKTTVKAGEEVSVTLKVPAVSEKMANVEYTVVFDKSAFKVADSYVAPAAPTGATISMVSTLAEANGSGKVELIFGGNNSGDNVIDMTAGYTATIPFVVLDAAAAGNYEFKVINIKMTSLDEEDGFTEYDRTPAGMTETVSVTIPGAHTHVFDQQNTDAKYLASAASCTAKATYFYSCECGEKGTETFESGETLPHTASTEWKSDETGHWHVCKDCGAKLQVIEHTPDHEGGATETYPIKCTECGYVIEAQLDHTHSFTQEVAEAKYLKSDADCTKDAVYYKSCTCGVASTTDTFIATGTALGHSWGQHVADKNRKSPADCENPAVYYVSCCRCDARDTENTFTYGEKLGHKGGEWQSDETGHWMVCVRCSNEFNKADHQPLDGTPNCVNDAVCQVCGYEVAKSDSSIHTKIVKVEAKAATCTENGNIEHYKCTGCGKLFSDKAGATEIAAEDVVIPAAHKLTAVAEKPSNCRVPGTAAYDKCDVCGKMFDKDGKEITEPTALPLAAHTWDTTKWLANKDGHYRECKVCGIADTVITPHTPGAAATETTPQTCTECGYIIAPATGHGDNHVKGNLVSDATSHWYACTGCSDQLEKANHTVTDWTIDKEATTTEEGLRHGNCTVCGHVVYEKIAKTTPVNPGPGPNKPTKPGTKDDGKKVESGKTFDAGIGVYVGLSILSLTGSAVVIGKKRKTR